jgi:hypothetical protein
MLNLEGMPKLKTLHVDGLKAHLISTSQPCDDNIVAKFDKDKCLAVDKTKNCVII